MTLIQTRKYDFKKSRNSKNLLQSLHFLKSNYAQDELFTISVLKYTKLTSHKNFSDFITYEYQSQTKLLSLNSNKIK